MSRVVALIQARMGSTRLPGKMLADLGGITIFEWVLRRVCRARTIDTVVLATTSLIRDDDLVSLAEQLGVKVFRGSETDVLGRFAAAAKQYSADFVVRVCADNPFVDPEEIDRLVNYFRDHPCDYACNHQDRLDSHYADGFGAEILSNALLQKISTLSNEPPHREHATKYIWDHASEYQLRAVPAPTELAYPQLRFDVDKIDDIKYLQTLVDAGVEISSTADEIVKIALSDNLRTLVTTDIRLEGPLEHSNTYFLGAWCLTSLDEEKNAITAGKTLDYHWNDRVKLKKDFAYLLALNEELLEELSSTLNQLHGVNEEIRYWRLLLGYWLNIYTAVLFDRWSSFQEAKKISPRWKIKAPTTDFKALAAKDTTEFIRLASESSHWNHALFALLAKHIPGIELTPIAEELSESKTPAASANRTGYGKKIIKKAISRISNFLKTEDKYFLISSYLPINNLLALELALGQIPFPRYPVDSFVDATFDSAKRQWTVTATKIYKEFDSIARMLLPMLIPRIFIEGFAELNAQAKSLPWPKSPKVVFTSNLHFMDDLFKAWAAKKIANGSRLVIGEHGGLGVGLFNGAHAYELAISDSYLSTGWRDPNNHRIIPIGNFRIKNLAQPNLSGKAMMVCGIMPRFAFDIRSMMLASQVLDYFDNQFLFIQFLPEMIKKEILVRLYPSDYGWRQKERWLQRYPETVFDKGTQPMMKVAGDCRLFIATYNATTYIESLSSNFPTVMFWNPKHWEVKPEAKPFFDRLKDAGIFHETPQSAARHISIIWDDVSAWWAREDVQCARRSFCDNYAASANNIVDRIRNALINEAQLAENLLSR